MPAVCTLPITQTVCDSYLLTLSPKLINSCSAKALKVGAVQKNTLCYTSVLGRCTISHTILIQSTRGKARSLWAVVADVFRVLTSKSHPNWSLISLQLPKIKHVLVPSAGADFSTPKQML